MSDVQTTGVREEAIGVEGGGGGNEGDEVGISEETIGPVNWYSGDRDHNGNGRR